jgi:hypothetical protein
MSLNRTADRPGLLEDQRGAVMIMGLFMATMLIGAMWYMKGIGDAIVFRDRMQEGADHVVFSSAAIHARGMNLISVINIVMYALTVIHVVLSVLKAAALVCSFIPPVIPFCVAAHKVLKAALTLYDAGLMVALPALSVAGTAAAVGYPWYGSYAGYSVGQDYKSMGVAVSPSNIPGLSFSLPLGQSLFGGKKSPLGGNTNQAASVFGRSGSAATKGNQAEFGVDMKLGLPVTLAENSELCDRAVGVVSQLAPGGLGKLLDFIGGLVADCSGFPWETKGVGWKKMYGPAKNGNDWLQVFSFSFPEKYDENFAESRVALAIGGTRGPNVARGLKAAQVSPPTYFAQSEFYFDCEKKWDDESCNGEETEATFGMRWRARLKPVKTPDFLGMILGALGDGLLGGLVDFALDAGADAIKGSKIFRDASATLGKAAKGLGNGLGKQGTDFLGNVLDEGKDALGEAAKGKIADAIGSPTGASVPSVLH